VESLNVDFDGMDGDKDTYINDDEGIRMKHEWFKWDVNDRKSRDQNLIEDNENFRLNSQYLRKLVLVSQKKVIKRTVGHSN